MREKTFTFIFILLLLAVSVLLLNGSSVFGMDELQLTGIVKDFDMKSGLMVVEVKTEGCLGERTFKIARELTHELSGDSRDELKIASSGKKIYFGIDASRCKKDKIHKIVTIGVETK